ncbi:MAG: 7-cyano-7-deazaguanine synthase [Pyrinomonadaceae bacterium]
MKPFTVRVGKKRSGAKLHLFPGENLFTGEKPFTDEFGEPTSLETDLLNLAAAVYATDLAALRDERENYIRTIELSIEVVNIHAFERIKTLLETGLQVVSRDNWQLNFLPLAGTPETGFAWTKKEGAVLLFSGGMDSMVAASEFVKEGRDLVLVSHNSQGNRIVDACQTSVHKSLQDFYGRTIRHLHLKVFARNKGRFTFPDERENSQRTRSFLFLCLAALVTRRCGFNKVLFMAENGQFAIHLPLNQARVGPFSTHTADPAFLKNAEEIFKTLLTNDSFQISNPFLYLTKGEVFALLPDPLRLEAQKSASCWMISRVPGNRHCGICIPCISRRIAIEFNSLEFDEYDFDLFRADLDSLSNDNTGKRNLADYLEFISKFLNLNDANRIELTLEFCELITTAFETDRALELYSRVAEQSREVFKKYPHVEEFAG